MAVSKKKAPKTKAAGKAKSAGGRSTKPRGGTATKKGPAPSAKKATKAPKPAAKRPAPKPAAKAKKAPARKDAVREKAALLKQKEREKKEREREKAAAFKEKEREKKEREREKAAAFKEKEREKKEREREKAAALKLKEREQAQKEKERLRLQAEKEKLEAKLRAEKEAEKKRVLAEREAEKEAARKAKEEEKARIKAEKEAEKARIIAEREAEKEAARKAKEEERARRDAEREAYRKAKEAERERLRAEREAARRLRESKAARASKNAQREGLRVGSSRVYNPAAVPNQSGTTRRHLEMPQRFVGVRHEYPVAAAPAIPPVAPPPALPELESPSGDREVRQAEILPPPLPEAEDGSQPVQGEARPTPPPPAPVEAIDERYRLISERLAKVDESFRRQYEESFEMSWIHHDSALEGVVYTFQELKTAMDPTVTVVPDSSMQPVCEEIRRHRQAIAYVRELGERKRVPINVDVIKKLYVILHPEEGDVKTVKYRKDIPQHRLYFHEYAPPDKIAYRVRQAIDWLNGPEPKKIKNPIRIAARVHFDLVRTFPFPNDSGKVARLLMNVLLLRAGYPPAIIHSTERQRYYEALKGQLPIIVMLVTESITNALMSIEKLLDEYEARV